VPFVEQRPHGRQRADFAVGGEQVFAVALAGMLAEVAFVPVLRQRTARRIGGGQPGALDEAVVFEEADEHAHQQPMHGSLGDGFFLEVVQRGAGSPGILGGLPFLAEGGIEFGIRGQPVADVGFEGSGQALEVAQEDRGVNHCG
jgi:hypothetical protein